jgi:hypothetical protein
MTGEAFCKCGARRYASEDEANEAEPNGSYKCPDCGTFAKAHPFNGDDSTDWRCYECDTRYGSHGGPSYWA